MTEVAFDSEVMHLIQDLSLVLAHSPEGERWWSAYLASRYSKFLFCERYKAHLDELREENSRLLKRICMRNAKYSRFNIDNDFGIQQDLFK